MLCWGRTPGKDFFAERRQSPNIRSSHIHHSRFMVQYSISAGQNQYSGKRSSILPYWGHSGATTIRIRASKNRKQTERGNLSYAEKIPNFYQFHLRRLKNRKTENPGCHSFDVSFSHRNGNVQCRRRGPVENHPGNH